MKNNVIPTAFEASGCIGFDDERLYISRETRLATFEELRHQAMAFHKSGANGYAAIALVSITGIEFHERVSDFLIRYKTTKDRGTKYYFNITEAQTRQHFCEALATICLLRSRSERTSPFTQLGFNLTLFIVSGWLTWGFARLAANGEYTGHRALVHLAAQLTQWIGSKACIAIGSLFCLFYLFRIFRNIFYPRKTIKYNKS